MLLFVAGLLLCSYRGGKGTESTFPALKILPGSASRVCGVGFAVRSSRKGTRTLQKTQAMAPKQLKSGLLKSAHPDSTKTNVFKHLHAIFVT